MSTHKELFQFLLTMLSLTLAFQASGGTMEGLPGDAGANDLVLTENHAFAVDGVTLESAVIYTSAAEVFYLVLAPELEAPLMISPRGRSVQRVDATKFTRRGELEGDLAAGGVLEDLGRYVEFRGVVTFDLDGLEAKLEPRQPMLGRQSHASVKSGRRGYAHRAKEYRLKRSGLKARAIRRGDVLVRIFFVSSNPACERIVPRVMRFEEELRGPDKKIRFEYYGLPKNIPDDPVAREAGVFGVPLAIVYEDGVEIGRVRALELDDPEESLLPLLSP